MGQKDVSLNRNTTAITGDIAAGGTEDSLSEPVKIGGKVNTGFPTTIANGQRVEAWFGAAGQQAVGIGTSGTVTTTERALNSIQGHNDGNQGFPLEVLDMLHTGSGLQPIRTPKIFIPLNAVAVGAEAALWTPTAGKKFRLMGYVITQGVATGNIVLKDGTGLATILVIPAHTIGVAQISPAMGNGILSGLADRVLTGTGVATETVSGYLFGTEE